MNVDGKHYRTIWPQQAGGSVSIIDQTRLPHEFVIRTLEGLDDALVAIADMQVRGAPLIGATAAYGVCLAMRHDSSDAALDHACECLAATRPTAINLRWALAEMRETLCPLPARGRVRAAYARAASLCDQDVEINRAIGRHGYALLARIAARKTGNQAVNVLTHCNAGWLATVDRGTATAPIYEAFDKGLALHVWVDETRPRNQGASLTAWELGRHGVPHTVIVDNAGGHIMQHGLVDLCIVGTDRTTVTGDVCNKIGTYLKALAARDNDIPFYVGLPSPTLDFSISDGVGDIPIEQRAREEVSHMRGRLASGDLATVGILPPSSAVANYAFDVTPARLISGLITERGIVAAEREAIVGLFPERNSAPSAAIDSHGGVPANE